MKTRTIAISLLVFSMCFTSCSNNGGKLEEIEKQVNKIVLNTANTEPIYKLYPTRNMWNFLKLDTRNTPIRDKIAISCMLRQIDEFSSHAIRHGLYIKNRKRLFCP